MRNINVVQIVQWLFQRVDVDSTSIDILGKGDFKILIDVNLNND